MNRRDSLSRQFSWFSSSDSGVSDSLRAQFSRVKQKGSGKENQTKESKVCQYILLATTIIQLLVIIGICVASEVFGDKICKFLTNSSKLVSHDNKNTNCVLKGNLKLGSMSSNHKLIRVVRVSSLGNLLHFTCPSHR